VATGGTSKAYVIGLAFVAAKVFVTAWLSRVCRAFSNSIVVQAREREVLLQFLVVVLDEIANDLADSAIGSGGRSSFASFASKLPALPTKAVAMTEEKQANEVSPPEDLMREHGVLRRILLV